MKLIALLTAGCLLGASTVDWGRLYTTGFETPEFTADLPLGGQGGWVGLDPLPASANAALVVKGCKGSRGGRRYVKCDLGDLGLPYGPEWYDGNWEIPIDFDALTVPAIVRVEADVKLVGPNTCGSALPNPAYDWASANLMARNGSGRAAYFYLSSNGYAYANANYWDEAQQKTISVYYKHETPIKFGEYNKLTIILNYKTHIATFKVNNKVIGDLQFGGKGEKFMSALLECAAENSSRVDRRKYVGSFDNISVTATPAP